MLLSESELRHRRFPWLGNEVPPLIQRSAYAKGDEMRNDSSSEKRASKLVRNKRSAKVEVAKVAERGFITGFVL